MAKYTVGELRQLLKGFPDETELVIAGGLQVHRLKRIDDDEVFLEFSEFEADLSPAFRQKHPAVLVAFCRAPQSGELVQEVSVPKL
jgi:hypothetical protein